MDTTVPGTRRNDLPATILATAIPDAKDNKWYIVLE